ncbi:MAG: bacteriohemerythrin [Gammaproteobacteria bacterium]|nr:bacteriohemerythrin [Gammaproteobacteria bacterium]MBU1777089.1 bacteriohemerythrin [Gammaproteobacteria bacterium]MBU1968112.1 bacteriohemerythrin [Gammaproteobacteria bacterium]
MKRLIWTDNLNTGIQVIDRQHGRIVEYINRLYDAQADGASKDEMRMIIDELVDYTLTHFAFEETLMEDADYPALNAHKEMHKEFASQVNELRLRFEKHEDTAVELNNLMVTWLFNHILNEDARYVKSVLEK